MDQTTRSTAVATVALFIICVALFWFRSVPLISADEIGYLGNARWLMTGSGPSMGYTMTYSAGYSLLLVPFEWLLSDPRAVYKGAMVLNAALIAATVPALVRLARDFEFSIDRWTPWLAVLVALWPSQFVQAYLALPEIAVRLSFLLVVIAAIGMIRHGGWRYAALLAVSAMASYAMHPRTAMVLPLCVLLIAIAKWRRTISWPTVALSLGIFMAAYFAIEALNRTVQGALWSDAKGGSLGIFRSIAADVLRDPLSLAARSFGFFWYQLASTLLFVPLGAIVALRQILVGRDPAVRLGAALIVFSTVAVGLLGAASLINWGTLDHLIHGRYLDIITPPLFWFGVLGVVAADWRSWLLKWAPWLGVAALLGGALSYARIEHVADGRGVNIIQIGGFLPQMTLPVIPDEAVKLFLFAPIVTITAAVFCLLVGRTPARMTMALGLVIALTTASVHLFYVRSNDGLEAQLSRVAAVYGLAGDAPILLDRSTTGGKVYTQQYMFRRQFPVVDVLTGPLPAGSIATMGPGALVAVSGECLGPIADGNNLVRVGHGDPNSCPP
jgi:hypothetical protein